MGVTLGADDTYGDHINPKVYAKYMYIICPDNIHIQVHFAIFLSSLLKLVVERCTKMPSSLLNL